MRQLYRVVTLSVLSVSLFVLAAVGGALYAGARVPAPQIAYIAWDRAATTSTLQLYDLRAKIEIDLYTAFGQIDTPSWTPDGRTLVFARFRQERIARDLAALHLPSRRFRWLTDGPFDNNTPDVSPDGRYILYQHDTRGPTQWDIHLYDLHSGESRAIFRGGGIDGQPAWSPDGNFFSFDTSWNGYTELYTSLYVLAASGTGEPQRVLGSNSFTGDWSPDGRWLAFASSRDGSYDVYRADADGSNLIRLTDHPFSDFSPAWSPDGRRIAFVSRRADNGEAHVYLMTPDGGQITQLSEGALSRFYPAWRPLPTLP